MFLRYLPFALEQRKVYVAVPPLYGIPIGKGKMRFFADNIDYIEYTQNLFCKSNSIADIGSKKPMSKSEMIKFIYRNIDYVNIMTRLCSIYSIDPYLLETILYNRDLKFEKFKSAIEKAFRYTKVTAQNGTTMIHGLVGSLYQTVFVNQQLFKDCAPLIDLIDRSNKYYLFNGKKSAIYEIMSVFGEFIPNGLSRYKGLGEMPPKLLGESTIIPGMGRTLKQCTIQDVKKELKFIANIQSDKSEFVKGLKIRREDIV